MDLISADAFWRLQNGIVASYPTLRADTQAEAIVVGGGISGALLLDRLTADGVDCVLLERFDIGGGSTSASTGLLQYEIDVPLSELIETMGRTAAERAYWSCHEAIDAIQKLALELEIDRSFRKEKSFYFASSESDESKLLLEFAARKKAGFEVAFLDAKEIADRFPFNRIGAIQSEQAAAVDPYLLTHRLIARAVSRGARVHDRTNVESFECLPDNVSVETNTGMKITARTLIFATGYEARNYLPKGIVDLNSSFALVTKPVLDFKPWYQGALIWETARPYSYVRATADSRIIIGGEDEPFRDPAHRDALIDEKRRRLWRTFAELFPQLHGEIGYTWAGTFGETGDGLPYIGTIPEYPGVYFSCGYGGNGITYSAIAADIIAESVRGVEHRDAALYSFDRFKR